MMLYKAEDQPLVEISWVEVVETSTRLAKVLRDLGIGPGDRVAAYLPNIPEAVISLLAVTSIGAIWSSCSPDFGASSVVDRFGQIEPKILIAVDGYQYNGKTHRRLEVLSQLQTALPCIQYVILIPLLGENDQRLADTISWADALKRASTSSQVTFEQVAFDHPLWVLYSSGTTGLPKPIVQGKYTICPNNRLLNEYRT